MKVGKEKATKTWGLSFYHLMIWLCTKAVNSVPEFLLRIRGQNIVQLEQTHPSFTGLKPGAEAQTAFIQQEKETDRLIYFSCTPWFDFTALTNEHNFDKDNTIPRIAWGKSFFTGSQLLHPFRNQNIHTMLMRDSTAIAVKNDFFCLMQFPIMIEHKEFSGIPAKMIDILIRRSFHK